MHRKSDAQNKAEQPQKESTVTVKKSFTGQIKAEQKSVPVETKRSETERPPQPKPSVLAAKYPHLKEIDSIDVQISNMKKRLSSIVKEYKFDSVQAFSKELNASKGEYFTYKAARAEWDKIYGDKETVPTSIIERLRQKEQIVKEREANRVHQARQKDKGAR